MVEYAAMEGKRVFKGMPGAYAALFTPYDAKGRVDPETVARIMDYGYANGLNGFYLTGTTAYLDFSVSPDGQLKGKLFTLGGCEFKSL